MQIIKKIKKEWFLVGMVMAIVLAVLTPDLGKTGGTLHLDSVTVLGIALVFFLHGLGLSPKAIVEGLSNWKLHLYVQGATFVVYPLLWVVFGQGFLAYMPAALAFGFCYLFVLPSTISSSVAMTAIGKGNLPGAIFNASLSSILGVFITPLLIQVFMGMEGAELNLMDSVISISKMLLLPMILGQIMRPWLLEWTQKHKAVVNKLDKYVILLIVYSAFCDSIDHGIWSDFSPTLLLISALICLIVLMVMVHGIQWGARKVGFTHQDEVAAVFCGTKKTLAAGIPMAKVIFAHDPNLGMILLPIMLYHPIQIFYCAVLANRYAKVATA
ncbi:bile acid:sodium symporter [Vibrio breoganii]|uniref:bile acid:sodium symporter family protein n=1 Tax=Vibrio breoganii TaxID=553239 RepID=UPI000474B32D|nr:bile acid:sodium symporter family protein [Vibrio breoganii]OED85204.1 bile acid:sodium symporter [Vibrio breoganii ZF-55]PMG83474.1 bile acid:sodium symporter [Vibrio breoganii]PML09258.1 bile acid:sodium symporter [Vibrio breoganii]